MLARVCRCQWPVIHHVSGLANVNEKEQQRDGVCQKKSWMISSFPPHILIPTALARDHLFVFITQLPCHLADHISGDKETVNSLQDHQRSVVERTSGKSPMIPTTMLWMVSKRTTQSISQKHAANAHAQAESTLKRRESGIGTARG